MLRPFNPSLLSNASLISVAATSGAAWMAATPGRATNGAATLKETTNALLNGTATQPGNCTCPSAQPGKRRDARGEL
eukprot:11167375-Lingulodinium_polyedra.AAC.1